VNASSPSIAISSASIIAVACSGGSDSAAALLETRRLAPRAEIVACYVDHRVRPRVSIDRDVAAVRAQATAVGARTLVAHLHWNTSGTRTSEAAMRNARYAALTVMAKRVGASLIVTGHHSGDVAEWVLIAMMRGSGVDGLAVMPESRRVARGVTLVRPLLNETKSGLAGAVRNMGLPVSVDETNAQPRYARNIVRSFLQAWSARGAAPERTLARSATLLAEDREALDVLARAALDRARARAMRGAFRTTVLRTLTPALLRRVVRTIVRDAAGTSLDFSLAHCDAIVRAIRAGRGGEFHAGNAKVVLSAGLLRVTPFKKWVSDAHPPTRKWVSDAHPPTVRLRAKSLPPSPTFTVRLSVPGDTCVPSGRRNRVSLARFLAKEGVPRDLRASIPLLCVDGRIAAALGVRIMEPFSPIRGEPTVDVTWEPADLSGQAELTDIFKMKHSSQ